MGRIFLQVLNLSLSGSYVILFVSAIRLCLKKAPKVFSYALWSIVFFRLLCSFSFESSWSLMPINTKAIPQQIVYQGNPQISSGIERLDTVVNMALPAGVSEASINPLQAWITLGQIIWVIGVIILVGGSVISLFKLRKKLSDAIHIENNIYESTLIETAFVLGMIKPKIYLPAQLIKEETSYIIKHEQIHIRRHDPIIKLIAFFTLCIHWFNPLVWIAFNLMSKDMELSCDECVIKELGSNIKKDYSSSLLALATYQRKKYSYTLAFGENDTKSRVKNVLNYKKPTVWLVGGSILVLVVVGIGLLSHPQEEKLDLSFLNPNNLLSTTIELEQIKVSDFESSGYTYLTGEEVAKWIDQATWKEKKVEDAYELITTYKLEGLKGEGIKSEIHLYESEPTLARVFFEDEWRYYTIDKEAYGNFKMLVGLKSYFMPFEVEEVGIIEEEAPKDNQSVEDRFNVYFEELMQEAQSSNPWDYIEANKLIKQYLMRL